MNSGGRITRFIPSYQSEYVSFSLFIVKPLPFGKPFLISPE